jgi:hypothetical protein
MEYNAQSKKLQLTQEDVARASSYLLSAVHYFRKSHGLPLEGSDKPTDPDVPGGNTCEYCIIRGAAALGVDLGSESAGRLDVRAHS